MWDLNLPKPVAKALADDRALIKALFERPESLSAVLPYGEFLENGNVWRLEDGSLGTVFEATLLEHEPMTGEQIVAAVDRTAPWLSLPETCTLQVIFDQGRLSPRDNVFEVLRGSLPGGPSGIEDAL